MITGILEALAEWSRHGGMGRNGSGYPQHEHVDGKKILERISEETGGRLYEVSKKLPIDEIYNQIEEELRNQYSLSATPPPQIPARDITKST